ncbi:hypothetical protein F4778DRAFT_787348 [Xylariomycetidae sp. FL2044]|nr:hypothetical protein F4778DRAFT_787348 [Xylariomycetidae sp. FL2044]
MSFSIPSSLIGSILAIALFLQAARCHTTCFKHDGHEQVAKTWVPCNNDGKSNACCGEHDYCMDNGLCMGASENNYIMVQGCTDTFWSNPCVRACKKSDWRNQNDDGSITVWMCSPNSGTGTMEYCCGRKNCCDDKAKYEHIRLATQFWTPGNASGVAVTSGIQVTAASPLTSAESAISDQPSMITDIAVALGVGIPLGFLMIAAISCLAWRTRKRNLRKKLEFESMVQRHMYLRQHYKPRKPRPSSDLVAMPRAPSPRELHPDSRYEMPPNDRRRS